MDENEQLFWERLQTSDPAAWQELLQRYHGALLNLVRNRLDDSIRKESSTEDILESALVSFARRTFANQLVLGNWKMVWGTLNSFVINKCREAVRRSNRSPFVAPTATQNEDGETVNWDPIGTEPPPEAKSEWDDMVPVLVAGLPDYAPEVLRMLLEGNSIQKIAKELGIPWYGVKRTIEKMASRLEKFLK